MRPLTPIPECSNRHGAKQIKMEESEDGSECDVTCLGTKEELERFCETMGFNEKGMIRVPGIMETLGDIV